MFEWNLNSNKLLSCSNTNMQYEWADDDLDVPPGVVHQGHDKLVSGRKYVMYHGTTRQNAEAIETARCQQSADGMLGPGVYLSRDLQKASCYPIDLPESDRAVIKVVVDVGKVIRISRQNQPHQMTWHDHGYNTAWVPPNCGMVEEVCVWDQNQIQIINTIHPTPVQPYGE